jgi:Protein of unknown function (DUF1573)
MMKKYIYLFSLQTILLLSCKQPNQKPILVVDRDSVDIGQLNFNDSASLRYVLQNNGSARLEIKSVGTSCGCSKAYFSDSIISPGSSVELRVGYKATDTGHFKKHIVIETNADTIYKTLVFTGRVK